MSGRIIAQVIVQGAQIIGKAFVEAYKVAAADAANRTTRSVKESSDPLTQRTGITLDESYQILNLKKDSPLKQVLERYETLFKINDPKTGGSFYLQSKVYRAKERLELELQKGEEAPDSTKE